MSVVEPSGAPASASDPNNGAYAQVNGITVYFQIHGSGRPLVLLHGGIGAIEMFGAVLTQLAAGRQVIGVDLQAHGRTADIDRPISLEAMADDVAALLRHLNIEQADVMGYSMGGGTALQVAIRHPELVRKLVVVSVPYKRSGWYPEVRDGMSQMGPQAAEPMKQSPLYQLYAAIAPRPDDWPVLLTKMGDMLRHDYDYGESVRALAMPVLLVFGDADSVSPAHAAEFFALLGGGLRDAGWDGAGRSRSQLAILPGTTHYTTFSSPALVPVVAPFLDA